MIYVFMHTNQASKIVCKTKFHMPYCKTKFWCSEICLCFTILFYKFWTKHNIIRCDCL